MHRRPIPIARIGPGYRPVLAVVLAAVVALGACSHARTRADTAKDSENSRPASLAATTTAPNAKTHEIGDFDGDGRPELVNIRDPDSSQVAVTLRLSRGLVCAHLSYPDKYSVVTDVLGSTVLAGRDSRALWIASGTNAGNDVALAHRDGCSLRLRAPQLRRTLPAEHVHFWAHLLP